MEKQCKVYVEICDEFVQHLVLALKDAGERLDWTGANEITYCLRRLEEIIIEQRKST